MKMENVTPILRVFDENKTREFYMDFLGLKIDWCSPMQLVFNLGL